MRVLLQRSGWFAAIPALSRDIVIDTEQLSSEDASEIALLLGEADLPHQPPVVAARSGSADLRALRLTVTDGTHTQVVQFVDPIPEAALRSLVARLEQIDREQ